MTSTQPIRHPDLWPACYHEAAHAVAVVRSGLVVQNVDVTYVVGDRVGICQYDHEKATIDTRALILLAGGAAERRHAGSKATYDDYDLRDVGSLFKGSLLDPEIPYSNRRAGVDVERQRVISEWHANAAAFVEREWDCIRRVAEALAKDRRLTGDQVSQLTSPVVARCDPVTHEQRSAADEARRAAAVAYDAAARAAAPTFDNADGTRASSSWRRWHEAHARYLIDPKSLTSDDLAQFEIVDKNFAEVARAKRAGYVRPSEFTEKERRVAVTWGLFDQWLDDCHYPVVRRHGFELCAAQARIDALEVRFAQLEAGGISTALEERVTTLEQKPFVKFSGVWKAGTAYAPGDAAVHHGGLWICKAHTTGEPGKDFAGWQLSVKRGAVERTHDDTHR